MPFEKSFVSLLSTGLDSPIATYLMLRKGFDAYTLSFLNGGCESQRNQDKILEVGKKLVKLTGRHLKMHFVDYDKYLDDFINFCERKITCLLCKRNMIAMAALLAKRYNASYIVNGDILGEQASQTLDNLFVVNQINGDIPVVRPIIGFDKMDIIRLSRHLGFYELSLIEGPACTRNPIYPETHAKLKLILENETQFSRKEIIDRMLKEMIIVEL